MVYKIICIAILSLYFIFLTIYLLVCGIFVILLSPILVIKELYKIYRKHIDEKFNNYNPK